MHFDIECDGLTTAIHEITAKLASTTSRTSSYGSLSTPTLNHFNAARG